MSSRIMMRACAVLALIGLVACDSLLTVDNPGSVPVESLTDPALIRPLTNAALQTAQCGIEQYDATTGMLSGEYLSANGFVDKHPRKKHGIIEIKAAPG